MRERLFQFFQLRCRAMHFHPGEISHFEHFREQRTNIIQMRDNAVGAFVRFPAQNFIAADSESIEKTIFFSGSFLYEPRKASQYGWRLTKFEFMLGDYASRPGTQRSTSSRLRPK